MIVRYRRCSVAKCRTGLRVEKEKRKKLGLRQLSLFRAPKNLILREKWSQVLGQTLADTDSICEHHFPLDVIDKYYNTYLPNGVLQRIQRIRNILKPNALPMQEKREPEEESDDFTDNVVPCYVKLEIAGSHSLIVLDRRSTEYHTKQTREDQINELHRLSEENIGLQETISCSGDKIIDLTDPNFNDGLENSSLHKNNICSIIKSPMKSFNMDKGNQSTEIEMPIIQTKPQDDHCYYMKSYQVENNHEQKNVEEKITMEQEILQDHNLIKEASNSVDKGSLLTNQVNENNHVQQKMERKLSSSMKGGAPLQLSQKQCTSKMASIPVINAQESQKKLLQKQVLLKNVPVSPKMVVKKLVAINNPLALQKKVLQRPIPTNNSPISRKKVLQERIPSNNPPDLQKKVLPIAISHSPVSQQNQIQPSCKKRKMECAESTEVARYFNLNAIRDHFAKTPLPKSWTWIENNQFDTIIFVQISRATHHIRCYVECKEDLSIHVFTFDRLELKNLSCIVTSIDDILKLLLKVYNLRFCEATAVNETRSENCSLVLSEEETRRRKLPVDRCSNCRIIEKKAKAKGLNLPKIRVDINKHRELCQKLSQTTRSCKYYREKCEQMKKMLENLKKLCVTAQSTAKQRALDEAISELPSLQQEVVRACFDNANVDSKGRRYEANYAYECFLLQAASDAAYEHIRERNLLPLPCKRILGAIIGGQAKT